MARICWSLLFTQWIWVRFWTVHTGIFFFFFFKEGDCGENWNRCRAWFFFLLLDCVRGMYRVIHALRGSEFATSTARQVRLRERQQSKKKDCDDKSEVNRVDIATHEAATQWEARLSEFERGKVKLNSERRKILILRAFHRITKSTCCLMSRSRSVLSPSRLWIVRHNNAPRSTD